jgi:surfactin synthase thioesterase subunit
VDNLLISNHLLPPAGQIATAPSALRDDAEITKHVIARRAQLDEAIHAAAGSDDQQSSAAGAPKWKLA